MKKLFGLLATAALVAGGMLVAVAGPASAGIPEPPFGELVIDVEKAVVGTQPSGDFEVEVDCDGPDLDSSDIEIDPDDFDLNGDGDSEDVVVQWFVFSDITCTVEETEDLGATSVLYECDADVVNAPSSVDADCVDDESDDPAEVEIDLGEPEFKCVRPTVPTPGACVEFEAEVTITNTFEAPTTLAPVTTVAPPTSAAAAAVAARARFTG